MGYDGTVYVADGNLDLHALVGHSPPAESPWAMSRRDPRHTANAVMPPDTEQWFYPFNSNAFDDEVRAIALDATNVFVGGAFKLAGGLPARFVARWDGTAWHALGRGVGAPVLALASDGTRLFVGGANNLSNGELQLGMVAQWDSQQWQRVGALGPQGQVRALAWHQGRLYAAGDFAFADGKPARGIAVFDGTGWSEVGGGLSDPPYCLVNYSQEQRGEGRGTFLSAAPRP